MKKLIIGLSLAFLLITCTCVKKDTGVLVAFDVYCEMVANEAKPMALHYPMNGSEVDEWWSEMLEIAEKHQVEVYREDDFPVSLLFSAELTVNKAVVLIYKGDRLRQYEQWKTDVQADNGKGQDKLEGLARRFGRLLGYSSQGVNQLLSKNTQYRNLASFRVNHLDVSQ